MVTTNQRLILSYSVAIVYLYLAGITPSAASELQLFDSHVHYSEDIWQAIPADDAIKRLKEQGIQRAIVSSTPADGAIKLFKQDPEFVIPFLRPYRTPEDRRDWYKNLEILEYVRANLKKFNYRGLGEFHLFGSQVDTPVMKGILDLARKKNLILLAHSDHETIDALIAAVPELTVVWAHGGFNVDTDILKDKLNRYKNLYIDLSFREGITTNGILTPEWREVFNSYPSRFLVGTDTYTGQRWLQIAELVEYYQVWLKQLPHEVAEAIAYKNGEKLICKDQTTNCL